MHQFLYSYQNTPHLVTKLPPAKLMLSRKLQFAIPKISNNSDKNMEKKAAENDKKNREKLKKYQHRRQNAKSRIYYETNGKRVIAKQKTSL